MSTYVDPAHVTTGTVIAVLGVAALLFGLVRKILVVVVLAVVLAVAGVVVTAVALHGTHCTPGTQRQVCLSVH